MVGSVCVLIRKAPYGIEDAFAGLRLGLATIANGLKTRIILLEDGILSGVKNQNTEKIGMPSILETMDDLLSLDVKIYCVEDHLKERGIEKDDLREDLIFIGIDEISNHILDCDVCTSF
jgi:tRNA 2-thiouridine synthesizing protein C